MENKDIKVRQDRKSNFIIIGAFILFGIMSLLNELLDLPHLFFRVSITPINWTEIAIEILFLFLVGFVSIYILYMLEYKRRLAEEALRESEEKYRRLVEHNPAAIAIHSEGKIVYVNKACVELLVANSAKELMGKQVMDFVHPDYKEIAATRIRKIHKESKFAEPIEEKFIRLDGKVIDVEVTAIPVTFEGKQATHVVFLDITGRKQDEKDIRLLSSAIEQTSEGLAVSDLEGKLIFVNNAFAAMHGYSIEELVGKPLSVFHTPEQMPSVEAANRQIQKFGEFNGEVWHGRRDGTVFPALMHNSTFRDETGNPIGMIATLRNISDRKRAEEKLRESEERYRTIFGNTGTAMMIIEENMIISLVNKEFENISGYSREEIEGKISWPEFVVKEDLERMKEYHRARRADPMSAPRNYEFRFIDRNGNVKDAYLTIALIPETKRSVASLVDISKRKRMEEALRERGKFFSGTLNDMLTFVAVLELDGKVMFVNNTTLNLAGIILDDVKGGMFHNTFWWQYSAAARQQIKDDIVKCATGETIAHEIEIQTAEGGLMWIEYSMHPIYYEHGKIKYLVSEGRDITDRKRAEKEKEQLQSQLLHAQKMEAIGTLAGGMAHDFNNLLTSILGYTGLAMTEVDTSDTLIKDLKQIELTAKSAAALTRQLLVFGRKQPLEVKSFNINKKIESLVEIIRPLISENISILTNLEPNLWLVSADEINIEQVVMNLAINARDAMPEGGGLTIVTENVIVDEKQCKSMPEARLGKFICLSVMDTGVGMNEETMQHIFEPFFTTKEEGKGTGLGLSVIFGIVKQHEGWIDLKSELGKGTTFQIYLPASVNQIEEITEEPLNKQIPQGSGERILVVEDRANVRAAATIALRRNGYTVFSVSSLKNALDVYDKEKENFQLIFTDIVLPDGSGLDLVSQLISREPDLKILLCSGFANQKDQWDEIRKKEYRFLPKPYTLPELLQTVNIVLQAKSSSS